jgi:MFS family permease
MTAQSTIREGILLAEGSSEATRLRLAIIREGILLAEGSSEATRLRLAILYDVAVGRLAALRSRDFKLLFFGQLVSLTGSQMQQVAVAWQLWQLTRSPLVLGLVGAFRVVPVIVFALGGGVIADALDRRRLMMASQTAMALVSAALALLTRSGHASPAAIYGLLALGGVALAVDAPARQALLPRLVPEEDLPNALSLHAMAWQLASVGGPAVGGVLLAWLGVVPIYVFDALSFGAVLLGLAVMRFRETRRAGTISLGAATEGLRFLRRTPLIAQTMLLDFVATFLAGALMLMPMFADELLHVGERGLGLLYSAQPAGAALAAAALSLRSTSPRGATVLWSVAAYGAAIAAFGLARNLWIALLCLAVSGAADTISMVVRQTLRQQLTPDDLRGRMTSVNMIFFIGGPQLGEVEAGAVAKLFGARVSVVSGGLACVAAAAIAALLLPSLRRWRYGIDSAPLS